MVSTLDFASRLESEEENYTQASIEATIYYILSHLDIVEVAKKLGIKLVSLPKDAEDYGQYISTLVYKGDCPFCETKGELRVFYEKQICGCRGCGKGYYGDDYDGMDIFEFLFHYNEHKYVQDHDFHDDQKRNKDNIQKLFELFPEELKSLSGQDLNRYIYKENYFTLEKNSDSYDENGILIGTREDRLVTLASQYYSEIDDELKQLNTAHDKIANTLYSNRYTQYELRQQDREKCNQIAKLEQIISAYKIVRQIYDRRDRIHNVLCGKTLSEELGCQVEDVITAEANMELQTPPREDEDAGLTLFEYMTGEQMVQEETRKLREEEDRAVAQVARIAEERRLAELSRTREENPFTLLREIQMDSVAQEIFFSSQKYNVISEENTPLQIGDIGKLILILLDDKKGFSVIFGKNRADITPPKTREEVEFITQTTNISQYSEVGIHKSIAIPEGAKRMGGAQFIVLPNNTILIGGNSEDYGSINLEIVKQCLQNAGYSVHFLDNIYPKTRGQIYELCVPRE